MKKVIGLIAALLLIWSFQSTAQITCPPTIPHFDFYFETGVTLGQKVAGLSYCEPDTLQSDVWTMQDPIGVFTFNQNGDILVADPTTINQNGTHVYDLVMAVTDNGTPPLTTSATVTLYATKPNEPPSVLPQ